MITWLMKVKFASHQLISETPRYKGVCGKVYGSIFSYLLAREKGYWSASRLGYQLGTSLCGPQGRWDSLERSRIQHDAAAAANDDNHLVSPLLNLLKRGFYFTYLQVRHSKIQHGAYVVFNCSICPSSSYSIN